MKTIVAKDYDLIHVETPLGIVNIRTGLHDNKNRKVESIEIIPNNYSSENKVKRFGYGNTRLIQLKTRKNCSI